MHVHEEGQLRGSIRGFHNRDTLFEFYGGGIWRQAEYLYHYHYAYMPRAKVIEEHERLMLHIDGMDESVEVRRVR